MGHQKKPARGCLPASGGRAERQDGTGRDIGAAESVVLLNDIRENGPECLHDREKPCRPPAPGTEQIEELDIVLEKSPE